MSNTDLYQVLKDTYQDNKDKYESSEVIKNY